MLMPAPTTASAAPPPARRSSGASVRRAGSMRRTMRVQQERLLCALADRHRGAGVAAVEAVDTLSLLERQRGFVPALSHIYGVDLDHGFEQVVCILGIQGTPAFAHSLLHRRRVISELCRQALARDGLVAVRPLPGTWTQIRGADVLAGIGEPFALCRMFGAGGFAQLWDADLDRPVPLLVQPWVSERGLLQPLRVPERSFSSNWCVQRLGHGRMVLLDKQLPATAHRSA